jgi:8-oxo-dGTP diphosphatase
MNSVTFAVGAFICDDAGRVLLCQQSQGHRLWGLPGGSIRHGESPVHAVVRDVREETGMELDIVDLIAMYQLTGDGCGDGLPDVIVQVFRAKVIGGEPAVNSPKISRLAWYDPDTLPSPLTATTRAALEDAGAGRSGVLRNVLRAAEPEVPDVDDDAAPATSAAPAYA